MTPDEPTTTPAALPPVRSEPLLAALWALSSDMHQRSDRPCSTCRAVSVAISEPFGCYAYQAARGIKSDLRLSQANSPTCATPQKGPP